ncbi:MAG: HAMP domain-containing sensor histidine kinase [Oscillospiraceae bacterium]
MKSVKLKMMLLCSLLCMAILGTLLFCVNRFMEPVYHKILQKDMQVKLEKMEDIILNEPLLTPNNELRQEPINQLKALMSEGNCLDISHSSIIANTLTYRPVVFLEGLGNCELHTQKSFTSSAPSDGELAQFFRILVAKAGYINQLSPKGGQWIWGKTLDNGYILILSVGIAHVGQAAAVIEKLLFWIMLVLVPLSLLVSYIFASWFTKPICRLSHAAHLVANGQYEVTLPVCSRDEIGTLTQDFNHMTYEVNKSDQLQKDLISNISHDLRTPLTLMKGYAETIRDLTGDNKEKREQQLNIIIDETDRLSSLVNSVLQLGKLTSGVQKPQCVKFDICDFCEEILTRYDDICIKQNIDLQFVKPDEHMREIFADPEMMGRVLHNLLSNAIAHTGEDKIVILQISDVANGICVDVIDHGKGLSAEECTKVFDKYYRARQNNGTKGTGLGLSIVKAILQAHNFGFGVKSKPNEGCAFWFTAPLVLKVPNKSIKPIN